jgi:ribosomal protein L37AE/L43A
MSHPAYVDIYCEKHEIHHQEDICPMCWQDDHICEDHGIFSGRTCGKCRAEAFAEDAHMERYYENKYGRGEP